jgi:hypothetical protein
MTDAKKDSPPGEATAPVLVEADKLLQEIKALKEQAEANLKQSETARKNADSEALLASNAKKYCEDHATAISVFKGTVEADANAIATNKQRADEALAALNTAKANVDGEIKAIDGRRKEVDQAATNVDQSANIIVKAAETGAARLKEVDALRQGAEVALKAATESAKNASAAATDSAKNAAAAASQAETDQKQINQFSTQAATLAETISDLHKTTHQRAEEARLLLTQAEADQTSLKKVLDHIQKSDEIAIAHEQQVEALEVQLQKLIVRVEGLLPGATSAGLASSFNKQRSRFEGPQKQFLRTFVVCIAVLVLLALPSFLSAIGWTAHPTDQTWNAAWRNLILRLPMVLPVVWLAVYAGRNYMMSLRMEEDYAYKEAISTAFEGYKREMEQITASDGANPTPITILCTNILRAIAERPGRIYEGKQRDINLMTEIQGAVEKSAELSKKKIATG